jgi:excisionase family DNA binding protein
MSAVAVVMTQDELEALIDARIAADKAKPVVEKQLLTLNEVAKLLGLSRKTVAKYMREEGLPHTPYGRVSRFDRAAVLAWNASRGSKT